MSAPKHCAAAGCVCDTTSRGPGDGVDGNVPGAPDVWQPGGSCHAFTEGRSPLRRNVMKWDGRVVGGEEGESVTICPSLQWWPQLARYVKCNTVRYSHVRHVPLYCLCVQATKASYHAPRVVWYLNSHVRHMHTRMCRCFTSALALLTPWPTCTPPSCTATSR
jgi:hypothetical protein